jgi:hydrogenase maturation protease
MNPTVVIGLGNLLMSDEGIGLHVVRSLMAGGKACPGVDFLDLGASGMEVLHKIAGRRKAILVDCALMGEEPGTINRFSPEDVRSTKEVSVLSFHEGDLLDILALSERLGECPEEVVILGVQPEKVCLGDELSDTLLKRLPEYAAIVISEVLAASMPGT